MSLTNHFYKKQRLYTIQMKEGTPSSNHLNEFDRIAIDLKNIECKVEDEDQALILLCLLPTSFDHFVNTMLYGFVRNSISIDNVKDALNSNELKKKDFENQGDNHVEGLVARGRPNDKGLVAIKENLGQSLDLERESVTTVKRKDTRKISASYSKRKNRRHTNDTASVAKVNCEGDDVVLSVSPGRFGDA